MVHWKDRLYSAYVSSGQGGASAASSFAPRQAYLTSVIARHVPADPDTRIFDAGCGDGAVMYFLKRAGYRNISGVDISEEMVALAHQVGVTEARVGGLLPALRDRDAASLDVVFVMDVLEHLDRDQLFEVCDTVSRVLRRGGKLIVHVPNAAAIFGAAIRYGDLTHELAFSPTSIRQLLTTTGFEQIRCFEEKPAVHGARSLVRALLWEAGSLGFRLLNLAETGRYGVVLSRNMLATATKP